MQNFLKTIFLLAISFAYSLAQDTEQITVKLSDPGKPGYLHANLINGTIKVSSYTGKDVVISASVPGKTEKKEERNADGMRKISSSGGFEINATQRDNKIEVSTRFVDRTMNLSIQVPQKFSLKLSTINNGKIVVENVDGNHEVSNINGSIYLMAVDGAVVANTINGNITVSLNSISANTPMAFSSLNGDVDVTFPANLKANVKAKSDRGDVYSDFDIDIDKSTSKIETKADADKGMYKIKRDDWTRGKINGGGAEIMLKTMNGNVKIRKK